MEAVKLQELPIEKHDKRDDILDVAERLFAEQGFEAVTVREISKAADINIAMVSYYFGSKEKLYEEVIRRKLLFPDLMRIEIEKQNTYTQKLFSIVDTYINRLFANRQFQNIIFREMAMNQRNAMSELILSQIHKNFTLMTDVLHKGIKNKEFKKVDVELTVMSVVAVVKTYTTSGMMACKILQLENTENAFDNKHKNRLKKHVKELLISHLGIEKAEHSFLFK